MVLPSTFFPLIIAVPEARRGIDVPDRLIPSASAGLLVSRWMNGVSIPTISIPNYNLDTKLEGSEQ